jgi:hypothetical protein
LLPNAGGSAIGACTSCRRDGLWLNLKGCFGSTREERLTVRRRGGRTGRASLPQGANHAAASTSSLVLADGRRFRVLIIVDDFTRESRMGSATPSSTGAC